MDGVCLITIKFLQVTQWPKQLEPLLSHIRFKRQICLCVLSICQATSPAGRTCTCICYLSTCPAFWTAWQSQPLSAGPHEDQGDRQGPRGDLPLHEPGAAVGVAPDREGGRLRAGLHPQRVPHTAAGLARPHLCTGEQDCAVQRCLLCLSLCLRTEHPESQPSLRMAEKHWSCLGSSSAPHTCS